MTSKACAADTGATAAAAQCNTLVAAVKAAGLVDAPQGSGPFTVFAPTGEAFAKLPPGAPRTYHGLVGRAMAKDVAQPQSAKTVEGERVTITAEGGGVMVNQHVIDAVMLPQ